MQVVGRPSWLITEDSPSPVLFALYLRDAAGLAPKLALPPLNPPVPAQPHDVDALAASREWDEWWRRRDLRRHGQLPYPSPPAFPELAEFPLLQSLAQSCAEAAMGFVSEAHDRYADRMHRRFAQDEQPDVHRIITEQERRLGRTARPFQLWISEFPLLEKNAWLLSDEDLVVSTELMLDRAAAEGVLEPLIARLA